MSYIEEKEKALKNKIIPQTKKDDFEAFWQSEVSALREIPLEITRTKLDLPYKTNL